MIAGSDAINAFQWCKARVSSEHPEGLLEVHRFEASSKFFRSFVVVLAAPDLFHAFQHNWIATGICLAAIAPALWRYIDQRFKTTQQAYWHVLTIEAAKGTKLEYPARDDGLTHAGGVVYRMTADGKPEYLLVTASKNREQWVLPKGHIEYGENPRETAVREVREGVVIGRASKNGLQMSHSVVATTRRACAGSSCVVERKARTGAKKADSSSGFHIARPNNTRSLMKRTCCSIRLRRLRIRNRRQDRPGT